MRRVWSILALCIVLFSLAGGTALARTPVGPDTTPPTVWGFGSTPTQIERTGCPNNTAVMVQVRAEDAGGVATVRAQVKGPGALTWTNRSLLLRADGYWRAWLPKGMFNSVGVWKIRIRAQDYAGNVTTTGINYLGVVNCAVYD